MYKAIQHNMQLGCNCWLRHHIPLQLLRATTVRSEILIFFGTSAYMVGVCVAILYLLQSILTRKKQMLPGTRA